MKITIDTKEDSREDIRNAIRMLQHLVGDHPASSQPNVFEDSQPAVGSNEDTFSNFFDNQETQEKKKEKEDIPRIIEY